MISDHRGGTADHLDLTRREALGALALGLPAGAALAGGGAPSVQIRPAIAALVTEYRKASHGQGIVDRFLDGYGWQGRHHQPPVDVVALFVDQKPRGDLSQERASRHSGLTLYPTIAEALTRGTGKLAVDGVLLIGEHGDYPRNARGQTLYPRYEFFQQIVAVFRASGRCAPVFNDKHLSWRWDWAKEMVETARADGLSPDGRLVAAGHLANSLHRSSLGCRGAGGGLCRVWRRRQLRHPRPGILAVHGRTTTRR